MYERYKKKILTFYRENRRMPGYKEMMDLLGFKSKNSVYKFIQKLVDEGVVEKDSRGKLSPKNLFGETPLLGVIEAGFPSAAEEELTDTMSFDEFLIQNKEATYILKVKGDSMIEAGIQEGDMVVVERGPLPKDGDIVIAEIDGGWTMKYYRSRNRRVYLEPANRTLKNIYPEQSLNVAAVVRAVVRKY